ncbi:MAG: tRNA lysidine(34) synthetase TilS [Rhodocyclaceae bacterium]
MAAAVAACLSAAGVAAGSRLALALSGGVDSMLLLHVLARLREVQGWALSAAHVHHGLSPHADAWAAACVTAGERLGVPVEVHRVEVLRGSDDGLESAARRARHAALATVAADWLVFAHHRDDQAETLLFRLLRGCGVRGAAAMASIEPAHAGCAGRLRPLLGVGRQEVLACAQARGIEWCEDESNADLFFARNYLRHRVLPQMAERFPAAGAALARAAGHFREASGLLDELADEDLSRCGGVPVPVGALLGLGDARGRNLLRRLIERQGWRAPTSSRLDEALRQLRAASGPLRLVLGDGALGVYRGRLWPLANAMGQRGDEATVEATVPVPVPVWQGEAELSWGGGWVCMSPSVGAGLSTQRLNAAPSCLLTGRWPGLEMRPAAGRPHKRFKQLCQEAGVPPWLRDRLPVLRVGDEAAWIGGLGEGFEVSADFACAPGEAGVVLAWTPASEPRLDGASTGSRSGRCS